jgi:hypothetical protein
MNLTSLLEKANVFARIVADSKGAAFCTILRWLHGSGSFQGAPGDTVDPDDLLHLLMARERKGATALG